jgi:magnesium-transporting ATPase (P-type)
MHFSGINVISLLPDGDSFGRNIDDKSPENVIMDLKEAQTMTILCICNELMRAYTCGSQKASLYAMGFFSNKYMHISVLTSLSLTWFVALVPPFQSIFGMRYLSDIKGYILVVIMAFTPAVIDELTKLILRMLDFRESHVIKRNDVINRASSFAINVAPSTRYNLKSPH